MAEQPGTALLMFIAYRAAENRIVDALRRAGFTDVTLAQVAKQTATALVDRLEAAGYVERVVDPTDGRGRLVRLGPRGLQAIPVARAEEAAIEAEWTQHLGRRRMAQLHEALARLREITDPYDSPMTDARRPSPSRIISGEFVT